MEFVILSYISVQSALSLAILGILFKIQSKLGKDEEINELIKKKCPIFGQPICPIKGLK